VTSLADVAKYVARDYELQHAAADRQAGYADDPVAYCREVLKFEPWSKQREILESIRDHRRTAVRSCHGVGKTAIAARAALWFLATHPRSRVITTAATWNQVETQLWKEIHQARALAGGNVGGKLTSTRLDLGPDWFAIGFSTDRPERFQGHHADYLLLVVDEASGVADAIFEAAQGFFTAEGARLLLIGNPTQLSGEFFDAFHSKRAAYSLISMGAFDSPAFTGEPVPPEVLRVLPTEQWVDESRELYGEASPLWDVRVLGEFPRTSDDTVVALADIERAHRFTSERGTPVVVACDVARFGSDETVIATRFDRQVRIAEVLSGRDTMEVVGAIMRVARKARETGLDWPTIVIDDVGVGGGVTDRLRELKKQKLGGSRIVAFNGGERAQMKDDYPNRRSELWFQFADELPTLDLDPDEQLAADLVAPKYKLDSSGARVVEPKADTKKRLGRSPDRGDAVLMTFALRPPGHATSLTVDDRDRDGRLDPGVRYDMKLRSRGISRRYRDNALNGDLGRSYVSRLQRAEEVAGFSSLPLLRPTP
jgi:phage terminase large subunit